MIVDVYIYADSFKRRSHPTVTPTHPTPQKQLARLRAEAAATASELTAAREELGCKKEELKAQAQGEAEAQKALQEVNSCCTSVCLSVDIITFV